MRKIAIPTAGLFICNYNIYMTLWYTSSDHILMRTEVLHAFGSKHICMSICTGIQNGVSIDQMQYSTLLTWLTVKLDSGKWLFESSVDAICTDLEHSLSLGKSDEHEWDGKHCSLQHLDWVVLALFLSNIYKVYGWQWTAFSGKHDFCGYTTPKNHRRFFPSLVQTSSAEELG